MNDRKNVLTTGDVARICNVAPRTVSKWFDSGQLRGYRIPGSKDRRIPLNQLIRFMQAHGIPIDGLESGRTKFLILDTDREWCNTVRRVLSQDPSFEVSFADSAFEAGVLAGEVKPHALVVDVDDCGTSPKVLCQFVRSHPVLNGVLLIGTGMHLSEPRGQELLQAGFHAYLSKPYEIGALVRTLESRSTNGHSDSNLQVATLAPTGGT
ncbi:MAG: helix-turn-helix domain-containing protein [Planctomycetota bacterium]